MNSNLQTFANMDKSFEDLQRVKRYRIFAAIYASLCIISAAAASLYFNWLFVYCITASMLIAAHYIDQSKKIDKSVLDLSDCNITVDDQLVSVYQAAKTGKYETLNLYYDEIDEITISRTAPVIYVRLNENAEHSTYFIDGNNLGLFSVAEIDGSNYFLDDFRQIYKTIIRNIHNSESDVTVPSEEPKWKEKHDTLRMLIPALILLIPPIALAILGVLL